MKTMNHNVVAVLPALLNKSKTQTIRAAFNKDGSPKPAKYAVGDIIQHIWKEEEPAGTLFCQNDGNVVKKTFKSQKQLHKCFPAKVRRFMVTPFPQVLGTATITEIFKIEISECPYHQELGRHFYIKHLTMYDAHTPKVEDIAAADGFSSSEEMFKALDELYDLSSPKEFYVYRWKWNPPEANK